MRIVVLYVEKGFRYNGCSFAMNYVVMSLLISNIDTILFLYREDKSSLSRS